MIIRKEREFSVTEFGRPEDVLIAKLEWAKISPSERQMQDAAGILIVQGAQLDLPYVEKWITELDLHEQWNAVRKLAV